jgi:hypothetical protein
MKCGVRVALGVAGGYFLGRTKKMKLALMLSGMAAGRRAGGPSGLLSQGSKLLSASPELSRLSDEVRNRLLEAGKGAALAVAARQVESLTDRVGKRVESLGTLGAPGGRKPGRTEEPEDYAEDYAEEYEEAEEPADEPDRTSDEGEAEEAEPEEAPRRRASAGDGRTRGRVATATKPATAAGRRAGAAAGGARRAGAAATASRTRRGGSDG